MGVYVGRGAYEGSSNGSWGASLFESEATYIPHTYKCMVVGGSYIYIL